MYRKELARVYELHDMAQNPQSPNTYLFDLDNRLTEGRLRLKHFREVETELQELDAVAWDYFKKRLSPLLAARSNERGWQALLDKLNEAKGYNHLREIGCVKVRFIPESSVSGQRTPDVEGCLAGTGVLCEVKTINISKAEAIRRMYGAATAQMVAYDPDDSAKWIVYVVLNFDDSFHEYAEDYYRQIDTFIANNPTQRANIVFYTKPPFHSATV